MKRASILFLCLCAVSAGCGYTTRSLIADKYTAVYIKPFENKIDLAQSYTGNKYRLYRPGLETEMTSVVVDQFLLDGNLKPGPRDEADLVLTAELVEFRQDPLRYSDNDDVLEYRVNIVVNMSLYDTAAEANLWEEKGFTGDTTYFTTGTESSTEAAAVTAAVKDLARRIVERAVELW